MTDGSAPAFDECRYLDSNSIVMNHMQAHTGRRAHSQDIVVHFQHTDDALH